MTVERETVEKPQFTGRAVPVRAVRQANGAWSVELDVSMALIVPGKRTVHIRRHVRVRATEQRGRRNGDV
jgi:hypothetical protein